MAYNFKEVMNKPERLAPGHRMCAGCGGTITVRTVLRALHEGDKAVIGNATGCLEVSTFMYPYTAYEDSYIHNAFENAGATLSGVETAYNVLKKKGKIDDTYKFITFGGDGGTYDIGLQSLSGAMERGHDMVYVCYDNGAYMNTGIQRSSATPMYADTTTTPVVKQSVGKMQNRKDLASIIADNDVAYAKEGKYATLRLPSGEMRMVPLNCRASIGVIGNGDHNLVNIGKAGRKRHMGIRPTVRGSVMNPNDHPHGGGEGRAPVGRPGPCTPWGKPALGLKTRSKKKASNKLIVRRRDGKALSK